VPAPRLEILTEARLPPGVRDLPNPPERLYLHGESPRGPCVALVGTRSPTLDGMAYARHLGGALARAGVTVLSGGAEGIDGAAHEGALAVGGLTVVVAPAGWDRPFPEAHRDLFERIVAQGGGYLSQYAPGVPARPDHFFARNALLAALAHVLVVVEAPYRSGARNAASQARRMGRTLMVVPHAPWNRRGSGWTVELGRGARLCSGPDEVLRELEAQRLHAFARAGAPAPPPAPEPVPAREERDGDSRPDAPPPPAPFHPDPELQAVLEARAGGALHPDEIARRTGLSIPRIQYALLTLTLEGVLVAAPSTPGRSVTRRKH